MHLFHRRMGQGPPIVILHGLFGSSDNWGSLARDLSNDHEVVLVDARDHGRSPHTDRITYPLMADDLFELLAELDLRDIVLVGHSMGGKTAMTFTQQHPQLVRELVVVDIGPREYTISYHAAVVEALSRIDLTTATTRSEVEAHMARYVKEPGMVQFLMKSLYWQEPGELAWRFNVPVLARHMGDILGAIPPGRVTVPTLFIQGGRSDYITREDFPAIREQFSNCRIEEIPFAGHWVHAQAPDEVLALIRSVA
ncbi:MAG: alpha/beta fold hydrolase [Flavobacteriales bacterium]|nr:alpha/beta fold hydrolase [Flavobacteriales bacterium]